MARTVAEASDEILVRLNCYHSSHLSQILAYRRLSLGEKDDSSDSFSVAAASISSTSLKLQLLSRSEAAVRAPRINEDEKEIDVPLPFIAQDEQECWSAIHEMIYEATSPGSASVPVSPRQEHRSPLQLNDEDVLI
mmetsp:Transcript_36667/g.59265  ORF Transcript_36667/g.59265 Transcript_36667/m.59265 type:complete len:136 (+) Transcript_36667:186-593(+)|eukprot:CAMPEP_0184645904 /NCGR_PEP_ID=MMETSP0308-20130426/2504_1 /TAXON_ID=38269 /ORGANISM="Gloeochaete witrockiana, Strain SAG 46.84" /LENGTH=135 /DNA_ID=CAMNT_0027075401 /DNA_START=148 /DNA_END=555 /DNA_ORIENTATION=-